jgi:hypothetical protein
MLLDDLDVAQSGWRAVNGSSFAFLPVVAVVVVYAYGRAPVWAKGPDQAGRDRRLVGRAVAGDREHDGAVFGGTHTARPVHAQELVRHAAPSSRRRSIVFPVAVT